MGGESVLAHQKFVTHPHSTEGTETGPTAIVDMAFHFYCTLMSVSIILHHIFTGRPLTLRCRKILYQYGIEPAVIKL